MIQLMQGVCKKLKSKKGFTLIEMIVVVAIIAILIMLMVPNVMRFIQTTNTTAANANAKTIFVAGQTWVTDMYANNKAVTDATYAVANESTTNEVYKFISAPDKVLGTGITAQIIVQGGAVTEASWTSGTNVGKYPAAPTVTPPKTR